MGGPFDENDPMRNLKKGLLMSRVPYNTDSFTGRNKSTIGNAAGFDITTL